MLDHLGLLLNILKFITVFEKKFMPYTKELQIKFFLKNVFLIDPSSIYLLTVGKLLHQMYFRLRTHNILSTFIGHCQGNSGFDIGKRRIQARLNLECNNLALFQRTLGATMVAGVTIPIG